MLLLFVLGFFVCSFFTEYTTQKYAQVNFKMTSHLFHIKLTFSTAVLYTDGKTEIVI